MIRSLVRCGFLHFTTVSPAHQRPPPKKNTSNPFRKDTPPGVSGYAPPAEGPGPVSLCHCEERSDAPQGGFSCPTGNSPSGNPFSFQPLQGWAMHPLQGVRTPREGCPYIFMQHRRERPSCRSAEHSQTTTVPRRIRTIYQICHCEAVRPWQSPGKMFRFAGFFRCRTDAHLWCFNY